MGCDVAVFVGIVADLAGWGKYYSLVREVHTEVHTVWHGVAASQAAFVLVVDQ